VVSDTLPCPAGTDGRVGLEVLLVLEVEVVKYGDPKIVGPLARPIHAVKGLADPRATDSDVFLLQINISSCHGDQIFGEKNLMNEEALQK